MFEKEIEEYERIRADYPCAFADGINREGYWRRTASLDSRSEMAHLFTLLREEAGLPLAA